VRDIRHDNQVTLSLETGGHNAAGRYLVIYVTAGSSKGHAELLQWLARTHRGLDVDFPPMDNPYRGRTRLRDLSPSTYQRSYQASSKLPGKPRR
jgi:hypothetical protein